MKNDFDYSTIIFNEYNYNLEKIIKNQKARNEINSVTDKQIREAEKSVMLKIKKLKDCRYHLQDGEKGANSMIFITEGDSATGSMVGSRDVSYQAIFSLRGKPENMYGRKKSALFENEELKIRLQQAESFILDKVVYS